MKRSRAVVIAQFHCTGSLFLLSNKSETRFIKDYKRTLNCHRIQLKNFKKFTINVIVRAGPYYQLTFFRSPLIISFQFFSWKTADLPLILIISYRLFTLKIWQKY